MWVLFSVIVILALLIIYVISESIGYKCVRYTISSEDYHNNPVKICFLADLHNKIYGKDNSSLIESIKCFNPDLIILGGDMVTSGWDFSYDFNNTLDFIKRLSDLFPVYYAPGNHEDKFKREQDKFPDKYDFLISKLREFGVVYLDNLDIFLEEYGIRIYGLNLPNLYFSKFKKINFDNDLLSNTFGTVDKDNFSILIAHNPEYFNEYSKAGFNLVLSGHIHGGIVSLPILGGVIAPSLKLFPKYDAGMYYENNSIMILTRGIGCHGVPIRIRNKAEIVFISLETTEGDCDES